MRNGRSSASDARLSWAVGAAEQRLLPPVFGGMIGRSIGAPVTLPLLLASYPLVQLSLIVAIAPGGLGIFDAGWLGLLRLGGISEAAALAFVVAQRAFVFVFVLVWAGFSALLSLTVRSEKVE
ncbi:MAG: flippase-like domain-containing protein [Ardenticatenaceae bacterium]|nr:flippase-like domain-containing protein [Ardenticatenaceae bacterium]